MAVCCAPKGKCGGACGYGNGGGGSIGGVSGFNGLKEGVLHSSCLERCETKEVGKR